MTPTTQNMIVQTRPSPTLALLDLIAERLRRWREASALRATEEATCRELSALSDRDLMDLGIARWDIPRVAREATYGG